MSKQIIPTSGKIPWYWISKENNKDGYEDIYLVACWQYDDESGETIGLLTSPNEFSDGVSPAKLFPVPKKEGRYTIAPRKSIGSGGWI